LLTALPGIGAAVLAALRGELPELGTLDRRQIASLASPAPHARESGHGKARGGYRAGSVKFEEFFILRRSQHDSA